MTEQKDTKTSKPPKLPGKRPPKKNKEATAKYNALVHFINCIGMTVTLKPGKVDWLGLDVEPDATFEEDKTKPGTVNIKVDLGLGKFGEPITLPASVKNGKLDVDTSKLPAGKDDVKEFVDGLNEWVEVNDYKFGPPTIKDGALTLTKVAVAVAPGKAEEKGEGAEKGEGPKVPVAPGAGGAKAEGGTDTAPPKAKVGPIEQPELSPKEVFPPPGEPPPREPGEVMAMAEKRPRLFSLSQVPWWEKGAAALLVAGSVVFGVGFMNAGDETKTVADSDSGRAPSFFASLATVRVTPPGRPPVDADFTVNAGLELDVPLYVTRPHTVAGLNAQGNPVDSFVLEVPGREGTVTGSTEQGGAFSCAVNHRQGFKGSPSGGTCTVTPPSGTAAGTDGRTGTGDEARTTETTEGKPWSLLVIPGVVGLAGGGLLLDEERRRRAETEVNGGEGDGEGYGEVIPVGGPEDDGIPPPKPEEVKAQSKAKVAQRKEARAFTLRFVLDKIKDVNAGQRKHKYSDGTWITGGNCASCAIATELTLSGKPASATPQPLHPYPLEWWREYALKTWGREPGTYKSSEDVTKVMDTWGDGARGILLMWSPEGWGHAINVVNVGGHVLYIDGQTGKEFTNFSSYSKFTLIKTTK